MKAALDAGHGARSGRPHTGACANGLVEDDVVLDLVGRIGHYLRAAGWQTVLTRPGSELVGITERARAARYSGADVFVSIHCNAGTPTASGVEAFVVKNDHPSRELAGRLVVAVAKCGLRNRGVKWDSESRHSRLGALRGTYLKMRAVLLEVGFLTSQGDSALLKDRKFRDMVAQAIAQTLFEWGKSQNPG